MRVGTIFSTAVLGIGLAIASGGPLAAQQPSAQERIVSIGGAVTEIVYALGHGNDVVGVDTTSQYPPEAQDNPNVGYMRALSAEGVIALEPDLVLMEEGAGPPETLSLLEASGISIVTVPAGQSADGLSEKIATVAGAIGEEAAGQDLAETVDADLGQLADDLKAIEQPKRVLFILSLTDGRPTAAGSGTGADAIIELAGGINAFAEAEGYKALSSEAVASLAPDVVVMMDRGSEQHGTADPFSIPALASSPAGQNGALIRMDGLYLLGFGPRTPSAARDLAAQLYPGAIQPSASGAPTR